MSSARPAPATRPAAEVGTGMGVAVAGLPALLLMLLGKQAAALFTGDVVVLHACAPLMLPLATLMISE